MAKLLNLLMVVISVHALLACTETVDEVPKTPSKEILVLFGPGTWGDKGYNDLIYKGLIDDINGGYLSDVKVNYYNPTSMDEAEKIVGIWKKDTLSDKRKLLVLANAVYKDLLVRDFSDFPLDTTLRSILLFESERVNIDGVYTFNLSLYGASYISGVVTSKLSFDPLILLANSTDTVTSRVIDGFRDGYGDSGGSLTDIGMVYLSDSHDGYDMADSVYARMYDWTQNYDFILPVIGGSAMGVFRYIREYPTGLYTVGVDVDQSDLCSHILGSMVKRIDTVFSMYLEKWVAGERLPQSVTYGLKDGYTDWVPGEVNLEEYGIYLDKIKATATEKESKYEKY